MIIDPISHKNHLLEHLHIHNDKVSARIFPNLGASLQELRVENINIIDGINVDETGIEDYAVSYKSSILFPFPNRIEDGVFSYHGKTHQFPINEKPLNNALHGLVYNKHFNILNTKIEHEGASISLSYKASGKEPGFPFDFELMLVYFIKNTGDLSLTFEVKNTGSTSFPMGMGWHPYFAAADLEASEMSFPSLEYFQCNERNLPKKTVNSIFEKSFKIEDKSFDDACSLEEAYCQFKTSDYAIDLSFNYTERTYLQFYTPPHRKNIAIEPMTSIANSFNNKIGFKELHPGEEDVWTINLAVEIV